jgi:hypothetical protein
MSTEFRNHIVFTASPKEIQRDAFIRNKIIFTTTPEKTRDIISRVFVGENFDFNTILPLLAYTEKYNESELYWDEWVCENWGTRHNAIQSSYTTNFDVTGIEFSTRSCPPFPVIAAFVNTFKIDIEFHYCDISCRVWGIIKWMYDSEESGCLRFVWRRSLPEDLKSLCIELQISGTPVTIDAENFDLADL